MSQKQYKILQDRVKDLNMAQPDTFNVTKMKGVHPCQQQKVTSAHKANTATSERVNNYVKSYI